jgi:hypothetical protein
MHQQLWGYKVEWKSVSRGMGGKKVEYHCPRPLQSFAILNFSTIKDYGHKLVDLYKFTMTTGTLPVTTLQYDVLSYVEPNWGKCQIF